ncbi:MAG: hypothetical protein ACE5KY_03070 [Candidatus Tectimicrobiota bacterium]
MYEQYWGLKEKPFENAPDHRFLYQTAQRREALARMLIAQAVVILLLVTILENVSRSRRKTGTEPPSSSSLDREHALPSNSPDDTEKDAP